MVRMRYLNKENPALMDRVFFIVLIGLLLSGNAVAQYVGIDHRGITRLKQLMRSDAGVKRLYDSLQQIADGALQEDPNPIDTIRTEGLLQGDPRKTATWAAFGDFRKMYALALAYRVTGRRSYLDKTIVYLFDWASMNIPRGDPIDDTNLDPAIEAYDMVKHELVWGENKRIRGWLKRTAQAELDAPYNQQGRGSATNNWHSHRLKILGEIAYAIGDKALQRYTVTALTKQIGRNLHPDGSSDDFETRDALHYHVYDLEPLLKLSIVLKRATGVDYYSYEAPSGSSIKKSVDWVLPYLDGRKTHAEFVHSTVEFDRQRAQNGEASYKAGAMFEPKNGVATLLLAAWFDPGMMGLVRRLLGSTAQYPAWQAVIDGLPQR
jgi:Alginate lyase